MGTEADVASWSLALDELVPIHAGYTSLLYLDHRRERLRALHVNVQAALAATFARRRSVDDVKAPHMGGEAIADEWDEVADLDALHARYRLLPMPSRRSRRPAGRTSGTAEVASQNHAQGERDSCRHRTRGASEEWAGFAETNPGTSASARRGRRGCPSVGLRHVQPLPASHRHRSRKAVLRRVVRRQRRGHRRCRARVRRAVATRTVTR